MADYQCMLPWNHELWCFRSVKHDDDCAGVHGAGKQPWSTNDTTVNCSESFPLRCQKWAEDVNKNSSTRRTSAPQPACYCSYIVKSFFSLTTSRNLRSRLINGALVISLVEIRMFFPNKWTPCLPQQHHLSNFWLLVSTLTSITTRQQNCGFITIIYPDANRISDQV